MKDLRTNKTTKLYVITEDACEDGMNNIDVFVFDNEEAAKEQFKKLVEEDKKFLAEECRDDTIEESKNSYCSFPDGEYGVTHYWVHFSETNA